MAQWHFLYLMVLMKALLFSLIYLCWRCLQGSAVSVHGAEPHSSLDCDHTSVESVFTGLSLDSHHWNLAIGQNQKMMMQFLILKCKKKKVGPSRFSRPNYVCVVCLIISQKSEVTQCNSSWSGSKEHEIEHEPKKNSALTCSWTSFVLDATGGKRGIGNINYRIARVETGLGKQD